MNHSHVLLLVGVACATWTIVLWLHDVFTRRLPNSLTIPAVPIFLLVIVCAERWGVLRPYSGLYALIGGLLWCGMYTVINLKIPTGIGSGDIKLALSLGQLVGAIHPALVLLGVCASSMLSLLLMLALRRRTIAHAPGMFIVCWGILISHYVLL